MAGAFSSAFSSGFDIGADNSVPIGPLTIVGHAVSLAGTIQPAVGSVTLSGTVSTLGSVTVAPAAATVTVSGLAPAKAFVGAAAEPSQHILRIKSWPPVVLFAFPQPADVPVDPVGECLTVGSDTSGGRGAAGCNTGGVGYTSDYSGPWGSVPAHTDVAAADTVCANMANLWVEVVHGDEPTRIAAVPLTSASARGGLLTSGSIEHALGNEQGGYEVATLSLGFDDAQGRLFRDSNDEIEGDEVRMILVVEAA